MFYIYRNIRYTYVWKWFGMLLKEEPICSTNNTVCGIAYDGLNGSLYNMQVDVMWGFVMRSVKF